jgi:hypothetical protein
MSQFISERAMEAVAHLVPKSALVFLGSDVLDAAFEDARSDFCGMVITATADLALIKDCHSVFYAGNAETALPLVLAHVPRDNVLVVVELCTNIPPDWTAFATLGQLPKIIRNIGVYYPRFFATERDFFGEFNAHHVARTLTESNKVSSVSYRKGVYITRVLPTEDSAETRFHLLRCSTNFSSPTENCRPVDDDIIVAVNTLARANYDNGAELNHVLAQVYTNSVVGGKDKKARIPDHSDKTKDMPRNALMAFVTFYHFDPEIKYTRTVDDVLYLGTSVLTSLVWKEKGGAGRRVIVPLQPGSVLFVNMDTNRLWTHEIRPSILPVDKIPTRLGYVVRCSKTVAVHTAEEKTCIESTDGALVKMRAPTREDMAELKAQYARENATTEVMTYTSATHGDIVPYSMNAGDYLRPIV